MNENLKSVITCDVDGKVETFSQGAVDLFGYSEEEVVGKMRVSDFSDGQVVLGHVVGWLAEAVEKGAWEGHGVVPESLGIGFMRHEAHQKNGLRMAADLYIRENAGGPAIGKLSISKAVVA